jgi:tRNA(Arg) A34 adenosine deaminase TadA
MTSFQAHTVYIRHTFAIARTAREKGNHPFGALLVDPEGRVLLEAENTVVTEQDCTGHAETNLMRAASKRYPAAFLAGCTLYTSSEPCAMCTGAIFWGNVRRVVFGLSNARLIEIVGPDAEEVLDLPAREILRHGRKAIWLEGPLLEDEASQVHAGFWKRAK